MIKFSSPKLIRFLGLFLSWMLLCMVYACGNDAESVESGTEAGGAAYGVHIASFTGTPSTGENLYSAMAGQNIILTAKVTDSSDQPVRKADVYFQFATNASGATLQSVGGVPTARVKATTDASGQAVVIYKAGTNSTQAQLEDIVLATLHRSTATVTIFRVAGTQGLSLAVTTDLSSLKAGESTLVRATVTHSSGAAVGGQEVIFRIADNNSGATLTTLGTGITDASGQALALYRAGENNLTQKVQDTIQAGVANASGAVLVTRVANTAIMGCRMTLTADTTSLDAGKSTVIRATILDGDGQPYSNKTVRFEFLTNNSGGTLSEETVTSNSSGVATVLYTAGSKESSASIQDIIRVTATKCCIGGEDCCTQTICCPSSGCCNESLIMNVMAQQAVTPTGYKITMTAGKVSLGAGETTIITAKVTNGVNAPVKDVAVTFGPVAMPSGGSITAISGTTDAGGEAIARYTAGSLLPTTALQDIIRASASGATGAIILTRTASTQAGLVLTLNTNPATVTPGNMSELKAKLAYTDGTSAGAGLTVTFTLVQNNSGAFLTNVDSSATGTTVTGVTDGSGEARAMYTAGNNSPGVSLQDSVSAAVSGVSDVQFITRAPAPGPTSKVITLSQDPATSDSSRVQSPLTDVIITAKATRGGAAVQGELVTFSIVSGGGSIDPVAAVETDGNGEAAATFTLPLTTGYGQTVVRAVMAGDGGSGDIIAYTIVYWAVWH
jgi:protocatechuate 3,4-dioxygenase beta subunit